ncbi:MalY/PatB family protein [Clostridium massiliamazoniense]|uniref:MalY/PatB family protein n=1 Tax=Clostridium massiliamazoniense TaxID=1347366 RepID=UPI0006D835FB|nr:MalY/PatB family protein [Clostridium massiliamazoniense]
MIDRSDNFSVKWSEMDINFGSNDLLPMWVADMDFKVAPAILESLKNRLEQGIYGYTTRPESYNDSIKNWLEKRFQWSINKNWLLFSPGVIPTISLAIDSLTKEGDKIMIQQPVYSPFSSVVRNNNRELVVSPLKKIENGDYVMDYENIENNIRNVKMFLLCNPHNPVGRVWRKEELEKLGEICLKHNVIVISDEIHSDIIFKNHKHTPFASISDELSNITITCMSPSKSFNIAGLQCSYAITSNEDYLYALDKAFTRIDIKRNNAFSLVATEAAYKNCENWLDQLLIYLESNADFVVDYINKNVPEVSVKKPEGTYLMWLDFSKLNKTDLEVKKALLNVGKVALNYGPSFGIGGEGFHRLNIACPKLMLRDALSRIEKAVSYLKEN